MLADLKVYVFDRQQEEHKEYVLLVDAKAVIKKLEARVEELEDECNTLSDEFEEASNG